MRKTDKIGFEDIFDLTDIEKTFEQTIEYDILQLMEKWHNEKEEKEKKEIASPFKKSDQELFIREIVKQVIKEELDRVANSDSLFNERFFKRLEYMGFVRNCPTCCYNAKNSYCKYD